VSYRGATLRLKNDSLPTNIVHYYQVLLLFIGIESGVTHLTDPGLVNAHMKMLEQFSPPAPNHGKLTLDCCRIINQVSHSKVIVGR
jgi:hypothetical protein